MSVLVPTQLLIGRRLPESHVSVQRYEAACAIAPSAVTCSKSVGLVAPRGRLRGRGVEGPGQQRKPGVSDIASQIQPSRLCRSPLTGHQYGAVTSSQRLPGPWFVATRWNRHPVVSALLAGASDAEASDSSGSEEMAAESCADCTRGYLWPGEVRGREVEIGGLQAYLATPSVGLGSPPSGGAILFIHDVFGWTFTNSRQLCDRLADATGFPVYLPDFFEGETIISGEQAASLTAETPGLMGILNKGLVVVASIPKFVMLASKFGVERTQPKLDHVVEAIGEQAGGGSGKLGAVGYCWGGKYSLRLGAQGKLAASVACHPSLLKPEADGLGMTSAATLFICAEADNMFTEKLWQESERKITKTGVPLERKVFPGTTHGFAIRCNESDLVALRARDDASKLTAEWFSKYLV